MSSNGTSIGMSIGGPPSRTTLVGWCKVFHQSEQRI
jgi:hypothetical protein